MLLPANGDAMSQDNDAKSAKPEDTERPMIGIDAVGNLTFCIPLHKTGEIFARGFVDLCRTEVLKWYVSKAVQQKEMSVLASKTGYQRFKDNLLRRG